MGYTPRALDFDGDVRRGLTESYQSYRPAILSKVVRSIHRRYIEPERIDHREMLLGGLDYIQRTVAEVIVRHEEDSDEVRLQVNSAEQTFSLVGMERYWALIYRFQEILRFIRANLRDENIEMSEIEYAACNGILHTLDPHSVLLSPELYEEMRMGTRGEFGGLGIVISIRDGQLTIISPIDGTPAARAGLKSMDRIEGSTDVTDLIEREFGPQAVAAQAGSVMLFDPLKCIRCGMCAIKCPTGACMMSENTFEDTFVDA